jgi:hypothetical protein
VALALATVATLALLATDAAPWLRGEGSEVWTWALEPRAPDRRLLPALALAAALVALVASRLPEAVARRGRRARTLWLAGVVACGWAFGLALLAVEPGGAARTLIWRTIDPVFTSHHTVAVAGMPAGAADFLDHHAERLDQLPLHSATHPPGPPLYYRALLGVFASSHGATRAVNAWAGLADVDPAELARLRPTQTSASIAAALAGAALLVLAGAAAAVPVAALATRLSGDRACGLRAAALWPLVPGAALMSPEVDQALALPVAAAAAALAAGALAPGRGAAVRAGLGAGVAAAGALFLSSGSALFLAGAALAACALAAGVRARRTACLATLAAAGATGLALFASTALAGHEPFTAALRALALHAERHTLRHPWGLSVALGAADLWLFAGPPIVVLLGVRLARGWRERHAGGLAGIGATTRWAAAVTATLAVTLLSGALRGEAGRILVPLLPLLLVAAVAPETGGAALDAVPTQRPALAPLGTLAALLGLWSVALRLLLRVP